MTSVVKHSTRKPLSGIAAVAGEQRQRNAQLRNEFPPRPAEAWWPHTAATADQVRERLGSPPFVGGFKRTRDGRRRGVAKILSWLSTFPGETWQARWLASGAERHRGPDWVKLPVAWLAENQGRTGPGGPVDLQSGLLMLTCGDVLRPGMAWMLTRSHRYLIAVMAEVRDRHGFARLAELAAGEQDSSYADSKVAASRIAIILACKGGTIADIAVGDCVELVETMRQVHTRGGQKKVDFYLRLRALGIFPDNAPHSIRAFGLAGGRLTIEQLVDRYRIQSEPVRNLLIDYLRERQPSLDFTSLDAASRTLAGLFWARIETLAPGIDTLRIPPQVLRTWKGELATVERTRISTNGERVKVPTPRLNYKDELLRVRALYLDIAHWAVEDPARWGPWVAPCPITDAEIQKAKERKHRKARMDQRTRERLPVLPVLVATVNDRRLAAAGLLAAAHAAEPGAIIDGTAGELRKAVVPNMIGRFVWAEEVTTGKRRNLSYEEEEAFWAFATIEVLRLTGIRCEELLELSHHSITEYRLPDTGELVPLLQIAPSKTDTERLLLVSPELADILSTIVQRLRNSDGSIPLIVSYDIRERIWNPPMPVLFQRGIGNERRAYTPTAIRKLLINALAATRLTDPNGDPLIFSPHDFRRIFVTDAIMNGLPPHIAQLICGHKSIDTTMGYKAVYPAETIEAHRAFIARRRLVRPGEEYRTPTDEEWDSFLSHFEKRKVSVGTCARAFSTPCIHEHACVRCSLLRPDPSQRARLQEIHDNLEARIIEAKREGWLGEVEGLQVSYSGVKGKLTQIDATLRRTATGTDLGIPTFGGLSR
ncbi:tyrosine-type recombinase/integrase [Nocardia sp. SYP-A9097]|uniref:site-specific integrase n=1 Tax=Nocardia sp. SYP-A9097 TaxID=2663237 RepID=UPI001322F59F|nr:site-specific integrase [Nocardia sp. SYP-A9097]MRH93300.1 tyrosine-type recombinase/integrase [Nocardia sp. SYP-A9097]